MRPAVGPVLSIDDAMGSKVGALYSRGEVRDYLDVEAIRRSGWFCDEQLLMAASGRNPGFHLDMFLRRLDCARRIAPDDVEYYGVYRRRPPPPGAIPLGQVTAAIQPPRRVGSGPRQAFGEAGC